MQHHSANNGIVGDQAYPLTQEALPTAPPQATDASPSGIAMLAVPPDADNNTSDYFLGGFTSQLNSAHSSMGDL